MENRIDYDELARRYLDLWQQYLAEIFANPDIASGHPWFNGLTMFSGLSTARGNPGHEPDPSPAASPDGGDNGLAELARRLVALEERLEALEREVRRRQDSVAEGSGGSRSRDVPKRA